MPKAKLISTFDRLQLVLNELQLIEKVVGEKPAKNVQDRLADVARIARRLAGKCVPKPSRSAPDVLGTGKPSEPELAGLHDQQVIIRDRVRGVVLRTRSGFYLYGRPGTAKTHTVLQALEAEDVDYRYCNGHLTPIGLFQVFEENPDSVIVIDDVGSIFGQPIALQILLAALGKSQNGHRTIRYRKSGENLRVHFSGGVIAISNLELHGNGVMMALHSRAQPYCYDPTDAQIAALIRKIAEKGVTHGDSKATPKEATAVAEFLLSKCTEYGIRPDVRMFAEAAIMDFIQYKNKATEAHWQDLVNSSLMARKSELKHEPIVLPSKQEEIRADIQMVKELLKTMDEDAAGVEFCTRTGYDDRTYRRRLRAIRFAS